MAFYLGMKTMFNCVRNMHFFSDTVFLILIKSVINPAGGVHGGVPVLLFFTVRKMGPNLPCTVVSVSILRKTMGTL